MKSGLLIYDREGAGRNEWFVNRLLAESERLGVRMRLAIAASADELGDDVECDFAVVRTRDAGINAFFEQRGIPVFNNSQTCRTANDKLLTYHMCLDAGIPCLPTTTADDFLQKGGSRFPVVVKARNGHGGKQVYRADSAEEVRRIAGDDATAYEVQPMCSHPGTDTRVYLLGGKIVAAAERRGTNFRSNYSLGGSARIVQPSDEMKEIANVVYERLRCDWAGIDFLPHEGGVVLNEIEDPVGARMLYDLAGIDAAAMLAAYVTQKI